MDRCEYCRCGRAEGKKHIEHSSGCPQVVPGLMQSYTKGWDEGRSGNNKPSSNNSAYLMGFHNGVIALETYENAESSC